MKEDIVSDILHRAEQAVRDYVKRPEFAQMLSEILSGGGGMEQRLADGLAQQLRQQEWQIRQHWHGARIDYIPLQPRPTKERKKAAALDEAKRTGRVEEAAGNNGISRATLYRMLSRK